MNATNKLFRTESLLLQIVAKVQFEMQNSTAMDVAHSFSNICAK